MADLDDVREELERLGATRVRVEMPDTDGTLRGKYVSAEKILAGKGASVSDVYYTLTIADDVFEDSPLTGPDTGWPDVVGMPDWSTLRPVRWEPELAAVLSDVQTKTGDPLGVDPRHALRRACTRLDEAGLEANFGVEYELYVFHLDDAADRALRPAASGSSSRSAASGRRTAFSAAPSRHHSSPSSQLDGGLRLSRSRPSRPSLATAWSRSRSPLRRRSRLRTVPPASSSAARRSAAVMASSPASSRSGISSSRDLPATSTRACSATARTRSGAARTTFPRLVVTISAG